MNGFNQGLLFYSLSGFKHSPYIYLHCSLSCKNTCLVCVPLFLCYVNTPLLCPNYSLSCCKPSSLSVTIFLYHTLKTPLLHLLCFLSWYKHFFCICLHHSLLYYKHSSFMSLLFFVLFETLFCLSTLPLSCLYILALGLHLLLHFTAHLFNLFMFGCLIEILLSTPLYCFHHKVLSSSWVSDCFPCYLLLNLQPIPCEHGAVTLFPPSPGYLSLRQGHCNFVMFP